MRQVNIAITLFFSLLMVGVGLNALIISRQSKKIREPTVVRKNQKPLVIPTAKPQTTPTPQQVVSLPLTLTLPVAFSSQAPFSNWDPLHEEACEEASLLMVYEFIKGTRSIANEKAETIIQELVAWQSKRGYGVSITVDELNQVAQGYYNLKSGRKINNPSIIDIKQELAKNHPVIVPAAGRLLNNPYYTSPGPVYHMLVVIGYDETGFITNDPGTRKGERYRYPYAVLMNAVHNWDEKEITAGEKVVLVFD